MTRYISITVDYEIFGNGLGDVRQHIVDPTERMAQICEKYNAPLSVFFEAEEYLAFERNRATLISDLSYDPAKLIADQTIDLAKRGHDFQLHLHPEWYGTRYEKGVWQLDTSKRTVDSLFDNEEETNQFIAGRKAVIEDLLRQAGSEQSVCAYRAGAFCAQPSNRLLKALECNGFVFDTSLVKGMYRFDPHVSLDFRSAPANKRHWQVSEDVAVEDPNGPITEVPIYSQTGRRYQQITLSRLAAKFSKNIPKEQQQGMVGSLKMGRNPLSIAKFLTTKFPIKLDFHNMSARQLIRWIKKAPPAAANELDVIILIGHTKEHINDRAFENFVRKAAQTPNVEIVSLSKIASLIKDRQALAAN